MNFDINQLPSHSNWPKILLQDSKHKFEKSDHKDIEREFGEEKWGSLYKKFKAQERLTIEQLRHEFQGSSNKMVASYCSTNGLALLTISEAEQKLRRIIFDAVLKYLSVGDTVIELGAGFGDKLVGLATEYSELQLDLVGLEITKTGRQLLELLEPPKATTIKAINFDFNKPVISASSIRPNGIIFSSYALHYCKNLNAEFFSTLNELKPKALLFFEPCYELLDNETLHGLLCKKYIDFNNYSKTTFSNCNAYFMDHGFEVTTTPCLFGVNALLPCSLIEVKPNVQRPKNP